MADYPALPLWTDSYLADTRHLTVEEHGAYLLLLMEAWRRPTCSLPDDDAFLARLSACSPEQWERVKPTVMQFWDHDGRKKSWTQKRLTKEREFVAEKRASQRDKSLKRWRKTKNDDATGMPEAIPKASPHTHTHTHTQEEKEREEGDAHARARARAHARA